MGLIVLESYCTVEPIYLYQPIVKKSKWGGTTLFEWVDKNIIEY